MITRFARLEFELFTKPSEFGLFTSSSIFIASETFDVGMDTGSAVALEYHDKVPFKFDGKIGKINIKYTD